MISSLLCGRIGGEKRLKIREASRLLLARQELAYRPHRVKVCGVKPIVNLDDPVRKTVGRRLIPDPLRIFPSEKKSNKEWRAAGFSIPIKRGVYRFHSHEEADQWLMNRMTGKSTS